MRKFEFNKQQRLSMSMLNIEKLEQWRDLKFGMFIHFGLYSKLAGLWNGEKVKGLSEWLQCRKKLGIDEYARILESFNPLCWDPQKIAETARKAGMKYLIITSKHHDGFALYDSKVSEFNITKAPFGRDILKPLVRACREQGLMPGFYYSQDLDWNHPHGGGNTWDFDPNNKDFDQYLETKVKPQLTELLSNYGPIGVIWFDTPISLTAAQSEQIAGLVHRIQPDCLVSGRIGHGFGDFENFGDNEVPSNTFEGFAETPGTLNDSWGYKENDNNWKKAAEVIEQLCRLASVGVNYLLNIGPDGDGRIPAQSIECLEKVGQWLDRCGEAIYSTMPSPFPVSFPWGWITFSKDHLKMYLLIKEAQQNNIVIGGVKGSPASAKILGYPQMNVRCEAQNGRLTVETDKMPDPYVSVIEVEFAETPQFDTSLRQLPCGTVTLPATLSKIVTLNQQKHKEPPEHLPEDIRIQCQQKLILHGSKRPAPWLMQHAMGGWIDNWHCTDDYLEWDFILDTQGEYEVWVSSVSSKYTPWRGGHRLRICCEEQTAVGSLIKEVEIKNSRSQYFPENSCKIGTMYLDKGRKKLRLDALDIKDFPEGLALSELKLIKLAHPQCPPRAKNTPISS